MKRKVQVILLQRNRNIKPTIGEIKEGMLIIGDKIHNGSTNFIWLWNGKTPTAVVPEWDINPLSPEDLQGNTIENKRSIEPQTIIIRAIEFREALMPKKLSGKMMIWLGIGAIVVFYVLFAGGG